MFAIMLTLCIPFHLQIMTPMAICCYIVTKIKVNFGSLCMALEIGWIKIICRDFICEISIHYCLGCRQNTSIIMSSIIVNCSYLLFTVVVYLLDSYISSYDLRYTVLKGG